MAIVKVTLTSENDETREIEFDALMQHITGYSDMLEGIADLNDKECDLSSLEPLPKMHVVTSILEQIISYSEFHIHNMEVEPDDKETQRKKKDGWHWLSEWDIKFCDDMRDKFDQEKYDELYSKIGSSMTGTWEGENMIIDPNLQEMVDMRGTELHLLCQTLEGANKYDVKGLMLLIARYFANIIYGKTPEEIRYALGIIGDFKKEEEEEILKNIDWNCEEKDD